MEIPINEWIILDDKLPEIPGTYSVLVKCGSGTIESARMYIRNGAGNFVWFPDDKGVIAWKKAKK